MLANKYIRFFIFLISNFLALYVGTLLMDNGPRSNWYLELNKAPWTPVNYMFGLAWTFIMICYAFYMTKISYTLKTLDYKLNKLYTYQWVLNVGWNYTFFNQCKLTMGLIIISVLLFIITFQGIVFRKSINKFSLLILPYVLWLIIAVSLNAYIVVMN